MKKYSVFDLVVIEKEGHKFICEYVIDNKYKEILTNEKLLIKNEKIENLSKYYSLLSIMNYKQREPLLLTKKQILLKYLEINEKENNKKNANDIIDIIINEPSEERIKTKEDALKILMNVGIIDSENNLIGPYKKILTKK